MRFRVVGARSPGRFAVGRAGMAPESAPAGKLATRRNPDRPMMRFEIRPPRRSLVRLQRHRAGAAAAFLALLAGGLPAAASQRVFVLGDPAHILQYEMDYEGAVTLVHPYSASSPAKNTLEATYSERDLPRAFPAESIEMRSGNILCTYDAQGRLLGRLIYDPAANRLRAYEGDPGKPASLAGRILEQPNLDENFRSGDSLYGRDKNNGYRDSLILGRFRQSGALGYASLFVLDGKVFGVGGDHIDRLSLPDGAAAAGTPARALTLPGSRLVAAAVSPWREAFVSDSAKHCIQRVRLRDGVLEPSGSVADAALASPAGLAFNLDGELFVANRGTGTGVLRFQFTLEHFVDWSAEAKGGIDLGAGGARDVALLRPTGLVLSENSVPLKRRPGADVHHGISEADFVDPSINSQAAVLSVVQYDPGGYTAVHLHPQMEQMEIVIAGRALWEVGEFEREVGPGDVIYCPRNVKHGYKVLGNAPFKFYQIEWHGHGLYGN